MPPKGFRKAKLGLPGQATGREDSAMVGAGGVKVERSGGPPSTLPTRKRERKGQPQRAAESALSRPRSPLVRKVNRKPKNHFLAPVQDTKRVPKRNQVFGDYVVALPSRFKVEDKDDGKPITGRRNGSVGRSEDGEDGEYDDEFDEYEDGDAGDEPGDEPEDYSDDPSASDDEMGDKKTGLAAMAAGHANGRKRSRTIFGNDVGAAPVRVGTRSVDEMWGACSALCEELELRGEMTEAEGVVLRQLAEDRFGPLATLFLDTTESRAHFVVGAKKLCLGRR